MYSHCILISVLAHCILISVLALLIKEMVSKFPEFYKIDCYDEWLEDCGSLCCSQNHNLRKNTAMLPWSAMDMDWCDFLETLDCYHRERESVCGFCTKCKNCRRFKLLCAEAWGSITLNSWRNVYSYVVAVRFNTKNWKYPPLPMTVDILNRRFVDNDEKEEILEKEKILTNIINVFKTKSFYI